MKKAFLCIQCTDKSTGQVGDFLADPELKPAQVAISPVFSGLVQLYAWCKENAWIRLPFSSEFPVGFYEQVDAAAMN